MVSYAPRAVLHNENCLLGKRDGALVSENCAPRSLSGEATTAVKRESKEKKEKEKKMLQKKSNYFKMPNRR